MWVNAHGATMPSAVMHFEIHAHDPHRALAFYHEVFGWSSLKVPDMPDDYWLLFPTGEDPEKVMGKGPSRGIGGGMLRRRGPAPEPGQPVNAFTCVIEVDNVDATFRAVQKTGVTIALEPTDYPGVGRLFYTHDTEGNIVGVLQPAAPPDDVPEVMRSGHAEGA